MHLESGACEHGLEGIGRAERSEHGRPHPVPSRGSIPLINMNGRIYAPALGQFLTPDPILQEPYGQGLNRYAYVKNSPLNYVDPSGFEFEVAFSIARSSSAQTLPAAGPLSNTAGLNLVASD